MARRLHPSRGQLERIAGSAEQFLRSVKESGCVSDAFWSATSVPCPDEPGVRHLRVTLDFDALELSMNPHRVAFGAPNVFLNRAAGWPDLLRVVDGLSRIRSGMNEILEGWGWTAICNKHARVAIGRGIGEVNDRNERVSDDTALIVEPHGWRPIVPSHIANLMATGANILRDVLEKTVELMMPPPTLESLPESIGSASKLM